jgi:hypothetical protein
VQEWYQSALEGGEMARAKNRDQPSARESRLIIGLAPIRTLAAWLLDRIGFFERSQGLGLGGATPARHQPPISGRAGLAKTPPVVPRFPSNFGGRVIWAR